MDTIGKEASLGKDDIHQSTHSFPNQQSGKDISLNEHANEKPATATVEVVVDQAFESRIRRKMDVRIIPVLTVLFFFSFLDRNNIGNASIQGLQEDLHLTPDQFNWCLTGFFFTYCFFELPSNILLKKLRPSLWLPCIMISWGLVMTLMGLVQNYAGLLIARLFLGITEAGLPPGISYYLTMWYVREELQFRQSLFFAGASTAGAFSGLLAYAIGKMDGVAGLEGWRWLFILEGIATVLVALGAFFLIYDSPQTAGFLTEEERAYVINRLKYQGSDMSAVDEGGHRVQAAVAEEDNFKWKYVKDAIKDWQIYCFILVYWGIICPLYGISLFLPTILKALGHTANNAQLMTIPIYVTAAVIAIVVAKLSDRLRMRSPFVIGLMSLMVVGFTMAIASSNPKVVYAGVFLAASGIYASFPGVISWLASNLAGSYKRGVGMAMHIGLGNFSGIFAANFYRPRDSPRFFLGHGLELGFISVGLIAACVLVVTYRSINSNRRRRVAAGEHHALTPEELSAQGDRAVTFRYVY